MKAAFRQDRRDAARRRAGRCSRACRCARRKRRSASRVKNHRFQPAEVHAPANVPIVLRVKNLDSTPMEFESVSLRVEKVVTGNSEGIIRLRPLGARQL